MLVSLSMSSAEYFDCLKVQCNRIVSSLLQQHRLWSTGSSLLTFYVDVNNDVLSVYVALLESPSSPIIISSSSITIIVVIVIIVVILDVFVLIYTMLVALIIFLSPIITSSKQYLGPGQAASAFYMHPYAPITGHSDRRKILV